MPTIIHGAEAYSGFQIRDESAWGTGTGTWLDVPIIAETLHTEYDQVPPSPEFGGIGGQTAVEVINKRVVGDLRFNARLDGAWTHVLIAHLFGEEDFQADVDLAGGAAVGANSHWYLMNNTFRSLSARVWKSGPSSGGYWSEFTGLVVTQARLEWASDGLLAVALSFVGKLEGVASVSGSLGIPTGIITTKARWLSNAGASFQTGATPVARDIRNFTITIDRQINADPAFLNAIDTPNQPGPTANRVVTCDIGSFLAQDFYASGKPMKEFLDRIGSKARIRIRDTAIVVGAVTYGMDIDFPNIVWTSGDNSLKQADAVPEALTFQAVEGTPTAPAGPATDVRLGIVTKVADVDTWYTDPNGNIVQS